jgi:hypothetical protein
VPAVPADIVAQQSAADSETDLFHGAMIAEYSRKANQIICRNQLDSGVVLLATKDTGVLEMKWMKR